MTTHDTDGDRLREDTVLPSARTLGKGLLRRRRTDPGELRGWPF